MAAKLDLDVYQGDDHTWGLVLHAVDRSDPQNPVNVPFDLSTHTLVSHIRKDYADFDETTDAEFIFFVTNAAAGEAQMFLSSEQSALMSGRYRWDLQIVRDSDDYITTLLYGRIKVQSEVTRP